MGGAALLMAQLLRPDRFDSMVLVEPILPPPPWGRTGHPLVELARRRRRTFPDRATARSNFESKPPFDHWVAAALDGYIEEGLSDRDGSLELACDPDFEAELYTSAGAHGMFGRLAEIEIPVTLLFGDAMDTFNLEWIEAVASQLPDCTVQIVSGADHFLPMARPEAVVAAIASVIGDGRG